MGESASGELPPLRTGPWPIVRWCAAQQNWDRIHHDAGDDAWPWRVTIEPLALDLVGQPLEIGGCIARDRQQDDMRLIDVDLWIFNPDANAVMSRGSAVVALRKDGRRWRMRCSSKTWRSRIPVAKAGKACRRYRATHACAALTELLQAEAAFRHGDMPLPGSQTSVMGDR